MLVRIICLKPPVANQKLGVILWNKGDSAIVEDTPFWRGLAERPVPEIRIEKIKPVKEPVTPTVVTPPAIENDTEETDGGEQGNTSPEDQTGQAPEVKPEVKTEGNTSPEKPRKTRKVKGRRK